MSLVYLYMGLGIYFSFANSFHIAQTSLIGGAYVVGLVLDTIIIDTTCALVASLFAGKNSDRQALGNISPNQVSQQKPIAVPLDMTNQRVDT